MDLVDETFTELKGEIAGPPDTPYEGEKPSLVFSSSQHNSLDQCEVHTLLVLCFVGGRYQLEIKIPETYPFNPPKVSHESA